MPADSTSTGKPLVAELGDKELLRLYPDEGLAELTPQSTGTRATPVAVLADVRARGYACSLEEAEEGVTSVAVALQSTRSPRLAINVSVPVNRMTDVTQDAVIGRLSVAADEVDHLLL